MLNKVRKNLKDALINIFSVKAQRSFKRPSNPGVKFTAWAALVGVSLNGILAAVGYLRILGYLGYYNIEISEAQLPFSTYLCYGYLYFLERWNAFSSGGSFWRTLAILLVFSTVLWFFVRAYPLVSITKAVAFSYLTAAVVVILPAIPVLTAFSHGRDAAAREIKYDFHGFGRSNAKVEKLYYLSDDTRLRGWTLFSTAEIVWIVSDDFVYKYSNSSRTILLRIKYSEIDVPQVIKSSNFLFWRSLAGIKNQVHSYKYLILKY